MSALKAMWRPLPALAAGALALHLFMGFSFIRSAAPTYDEPVHLASGYSYWATGRYFMNIMDHPPLSEMLSAAPLLPLGLKSHASHPYFSNRMPYHYGDLWLYENSRDAESSLNLARAFGFLAWTALLAWLTWKFVSGVFSPAAAALAVAVFALLPAFVSNNALVTTDAAAAVFYFGSFYFGWLFTAVQPLRVDGRGGKKTEFLPAGALARAAALAGLFAGLAMASKFSMFVIPPAVAAFWIGDSLTRPRLKLSRLLGFVALYFAAALLTVALVYKFDLSLFFTGLSETLGRLDKGRSSFVLGRHGIEGVWWYFPLALAVKTPIPALLAALAGLWAVFRPLKRDHLWLLLPPLFFLAASLGSKVQIGYRHVLPLMPFLAALGGAGLARLLELRPWGRALAAGLLLACAASVLRVHPHYLAYFNEAAGGPAGGRGVLSDSNLDWGQGLKALGGKMKELGGPPLFLSYFGVARPSYYGLDWTPLGVISNVELAGKPADWCRQEKVYLGVSATNLVSTYYQDKKTFDWLEKREPVFAAGHSILLYELSGDKDGLSELAALADRYGLNAEADCLYARAK